MGYPVRSAPANRYQVFAINRKLHAGGVGNDGVHITRLRERKLMVRDLTADELTAPDAGSASVLDSGPPTDLT
ncbi:hypothetical protein [Nocardia sp. CNY236]|uniref:hypothetical protein n=1 Tax=Nocardia sp. CNY236 TaxID=1169152 RepID=UPI00040CACE9|nr:hypothetical protein [Nocardia sp. CNY236]